MLSSRDNKLIFLFVGVIYNINNMRCNIVMINKKYIYNYELANYFIQQGCKVIETGLNKNQNRIFWCFDYNEIQPAYIKWNNKE